MKEKLARYLLLSAFIFAFTFHWSAAEAQIFSPKHQKKSNTVIIFPRKTKTVTTRKNLPPGQEKKIYGAKSAKPFAPGQRKKVHSNTWPRYNKEIEKGKHPHHPGSKKNKHD